MSSFFKILLLILPLLLNAHAYGQEKSKKESGYGYILKNYFSKRKSNFFNHKGSPRNITLYTGASFFRETKNDILMPLTSFVFGLNQRIKEYPAIGDLNLQVGVESMHLKNHRAFIVEVNPRFTLPDVRSGFPLYVGIGGGVGVFPRHIVKSLPALACNLQIFTGFRLVDLYYNLGLVAEANVKIQVPLNDMRIYLELLANLGIVFSF